MEGLCKGVLFDETNVSKEMQQRLRILSLKQYSPSMLAPIQFA
jgi:hypothetical protein